ncbi:hypothetical protein HKCCE3408_10480 [Rhodobacterales bacterium HKCCE3408]|nr:hypothetical protein [Rhodobacterales bacterium HKCCE3408]
MLRHILAALTAFALAFPALAQSGDAEYEELMTQLAHSQSEGEARLLSELIWQHWLTAPDDQSQELLDEALDRRAVGDTSGAIAVLDQLIEGWPDYAEAWNQRATMYFMAGDLEASLADVEEVLALEPRHFGALSGKAMILMMQDETDAAQNTLREALRYHPWLSERALLTEPEGVDL